MRKIRILAVAIVVQMLLTLIVPASAFAQQSDPPPMRVTDKTEMLDSKTEKVPNSMTVDGGTCDKITRQLKVTPLKGVPMILTETVILCPNLKSAQRPLPDGRITSSSGSSSMVQYAPAPSYTCSLGQGMGSGWTTNTRARWWLWYSYYNPSTGSYGTFGTSLNGYTWNPSSFTSSYGPVSGVRFYAVRFDTSPAAIQSADGTWCF